MPSKTAPRLPVAIVRRRKLQRRTPASVHTAARVDRPREMAAAAAGRNRRPRTPRSSRRPRARRRATRYGEPRRAAERSRGVAEVLQQDLPVHRDRVGTTSGRVSSHQSGRAQRAPGAAPRRRGELVPYSVAEDDGYRSQQRLIKALESGESFVSGARPARGRAARAGRAARSPPSRRRCRRRDAVIPAAFVVVLRCRPLASFDDEALLDHARDGR